METTQVAGDRRYYFVAGQSVELWEDPEQPFGWGPEEMAAYAADGRWSLLFNALVLSSLLDPRTDD
jgi:hypothetical protein